MEKVENGKKSPVNETGTRSPRNAACMDVTPNTLIVIVAIAALIVLLACLELRIHHCRACSLWMGAGAGTFDCLQVSNCFPVVENTVAFKT